MEMIEILQKVYAYQRGYRPKPWLQKMRVSACPTTEFGRGWRGKDTDDALLKACSEGYLILVPEWHKDKKKKVAAFMLTEKGLNLLWEAESLQDG